jgi:predicted MFS family arabinose efflux permease
MEPCDTYGRKNRFIVSLMLALFATGMLDVLASLFLVDIASTFLGSTQKASIGTASIIATASSATAIVTGIANGFLSVRFKHKTLLLVGACFIIVGSIGCFFAPNFLSILIFYPFDGVGTIIVASMAYTLIGEILPPQRRPNAIGWVAAGAIMSSAVGFPIAGFIAGFAGWRSYLAIYCLPIAIVAFAFALIIIPTKHHTITAKPLYVNSFKEVLLNKSATACLAGNLLISAASVWSFFAATFWRQQFDLDVQTVGVVTFIIVLSYAVGSVVGGRITNRLGKKRTVVITWLLRGVLIAAVVFMPGFWLAFAASLSATFVGGIALSSANSLYIEQVPKSRGTMMSITAVLGSTGYMVGVTIGGLALGQSGYQVLGSSLGLFGVASGIVIYFLASEPNTIVQVEKRYKQNL